MTTPVTYPRPLIVHLTEKELLANNFDPLMLGIDQNLRFQVLDDADAVVSLAGVTLIEATFTQDGTSVVLSTANLITGSTYEIKIDTDQSVETGNTGKGWYQLNNSSDSDFITKLTPAQGRGTYQIDITFTTGVRRHAKGNYDIG